MKAVTLAFALLCALLDSNRVTAATIGFTGPYGVSNWTLTQNPAVGDGSVNTGLAPASITITGSNNGGVVGYAKSDTDYTVVAADTGLVSFHWNYSSTDYGDFDGFGYLHNGVFAQLADNSSQGTGSTQFSVLMGDTFGFRVFARDNDFAPGVATISSFAAPVVPEPTSMVIFGVGALGMAYCSRRRVRA